ncbi:MAG: ABC transporter permease [Firmicutes bacterium]|jgi:peptide/nickel transport system permease protein|nr:ABC transporter permease [Bacillota bacterium]
MLAYIGRRLLLLIPTMLGIVLVVLIFIVITPGDPVRLMSGDLLTEEEMEELRIELGLRDPFFVRYVNYIGKLLRGDFGTSYKTKRAVLDELLKRFPFTLLLVSMSMLLAVGIGIPLGVYAATNQYSWKDNAAIFASLFCVSMPNFWFALMLIQLVCVKLGLLPTAGVDTWKGWILPAITNALGYAATIARQTRSNMLEVIRQDYITTARAKGQSERNVLFRHALKNAVIPVIMIIGSVFGIALGGSMISEVIFSIPGLGSYTLSALQSRDYPVIQGSVLFISTLFALVLLIVDIVFAIIDPRIRSQYIVKKKKAVSGEAAS